MRTLISPQQLHRIQRQIDRNGHECRFTRGAVNDFGEHTGAVEEVHNCKGLFHESSGFLKIKLADSGKVQTEKTPMVLLLYTDKIRIGDKVEINGISYTVQGMVNIRNSNVLLDVSLGGGTDD